MQNACLFAHCQTVGSWKQFISIFLNGSCLVSLNSGKVGAGILQRSIDRPTTCVSSMCDVSFDSVSKWHMSWPTMCCRSWPCGFFHGTESSQTKRRRPSRCSLRPLVVFVKKDQKATQRKSSIYNTTTCCCLFLLTLTAGFSIFSASPFSCYHSKRRRIDNRPTASSFCYPKEKRTTG